MSALPYILQSLACGLVAGLLLCGLIIAYRRWSEHRRSLAANDSRYLPGVDTAGRPPLTLVDRLLLAAVSVLIGFLIMNIVVPEEQRPDWSNFATALLWLPLALQCFFGGAGVLREGRDLRILGFVYLAIFALDLISSFRFY